MNALIYEEHWGVAGAVDLSLDATSCSTNAIIIMGMRMTTRTRALPKRNHSAGGSSPLLRNVLCLHALLLISCKVSSCVAYHDEHKIWPAASKTERYSDPTIVLRTAKPLLSSCWNFEYSFDGGKSSKKVDAILQQAEDRFYKILERIPNHPQPDYFPVNPSNKDLWQVQGVRVHMTTKDDELQHGVDESYSLEVRPVIDTEPLVLLTAATVYGALQGLQTLLQLFKFGWLDPDDGTAVYLLQDAPFQIVDAPVYPYRGLLIDTSRHYLPLELILHNLDAMSMTKLNVLHWHMTDMQSFPYKGQKFPELAEKGAYCPTCVYTQEMVKMVIREAALRGIRVIPEFDLPGHSQAIGASHPEFLTPCGSKNEPMQPLDVTKPIVLNFTHELYNEIDALFPDEWIHIGGDEVPLLCWAMNPDIQQWMKNRNMTSTVELLKYTEMNMLTYVTETLQRRPVAWQEVFDTGLQLPQQTVVDVWKPHYQTTIENATRQGIAVVLSTCWYLDHLDQTVQNYYKCDPRDFNGTQAQKDLVLGGRASMWGERVDESNFLPRVWPRAAVTAEKLWTGNSTTAKTNFEQRLHNFRCYMKLHGVPASPFDPGTCEMNMERASSRLQHMTSHQATAALRRREMRVS